MSELRLEGAHAKTFLACVISSAAKLPIRADKIEYKYNIVSRQERDFCVTLKGDASQITFDRTDMIELVEGWLDRRYGEKAQVTIRDTGDARPSATIQINGLSDRRMLEIQTIAENTRLRTAAAPTPA